MQLNQYNRLTAEFYQREDTVEIAKALLGQLLVTEFDGQRTVGRIVETEAYKAPEDQACHAYLNRNTKRTKTMFLPGGVAYIYLCYGIHHLFNVVTGPAGCAHAVLVRAVEPVEGIKHMLARRGHAKVKRNLTAGPGILSQALGLRKQYDAISLIAPGSPIYLAAAPSVDEAQIVACPRIGIDYAGESVDWPWRFYERESKWVSKYYKIS
ncbi:MAG: DNA-3-methyladenine glycosylase [Bacteroidota bacterium]